MQTDYPRPVTPIDPSVALVDPRLERSIEGLDRVVACWPHEGEPAELIRALKYGRASGVVTEMAERMAELAPPADLVTWVPATPAHRRQRGFDQSELLARAVARRLGFPARRLLRRRSDVSQTGQRRLARLSGPDLLPTRRRAVRVGHVLVIDDVCTTGATLREAAAVVRAQGVRGVTGLVVTSVDTRT